MLQKMKNKTFLKILFILYLLALLFILFLARGSSGGLYEWKIFSKEHLGMVNFIPFATIRTFLERLNENTINADIVVRNIAVNLLMFVPMGAVLPLIFPKRFDCFWKTVLFVALLVVGIEILQFITFCGSADIDDVIFNTVGAMAGYAIFYFLSKIHQKSSSL